MNDLCFILKNVHYCNEPNKRALHEITCQLHDITLKSNGNQTRKTENDE